MGGRCYYLVTFAALAPGIIAKLSSPLLNQGSAAIFCLEERTIWSGLEFVLPLGEQTLVDAQVASHCRGVAAFLGKTDRIAFEG